MKYLVIAAVCLGTALARPDGAGGHHGAHHSGGHGHSAPAASAPATGYEQPASGYEQPASGYEAAATGYDQSGYDQSGYDQSGYSSPSATGGGYAPAEADSGIDLNMILIPILIIAGLALLFPSVTSVSVDASKRRKRDAEGKSYANIEKKASRVGPDMQRNPLKRVKIPYTRDISHVFFIILNFLLKKKYIRSNPAYLASQN